MNRLYTNNLLKLLGRLVQEYEIDINDERFGGDERGLLLTAQEESTFYGRDYVPIKSMAEGAIRESAGSAERVEVPDHGAKTGFRAGAKVRIK